jgi:hypothetical protein
VRVSVSYTARLSSHVARGENLNAPIDGVRPAPNFLNVIQTVSDASARANNVTVSGSVGLVAPSPAASQPRFNWKRLSFNGYYTYTHDRNNSDGVFSTPASGTLDTEWGPRAGSTPHRLSVGVTSTQVKNLNFNVAVNVNDGAYYNDTTGYDDNGDLFFNDRPVGVSRNSAQGPDWNGTLSARLSYSFLFGKPSSTAPPGIMLTGGAGGITVGTAPPPTGRYRVSINVFASNLTNRSNYAGYIGSLASSDFASPTSSGEPRRIQVSVNFGF